MVDDPMFSSDTPEGKGEKPPEPNQAPTGVTPEQMVQVTQPIVEQVTELAAQVSTLAQHVGGLQAPPAPVADPVPTGDFYEEFNANPQEAIRTVANQSLAEQMKPVGDILQRLNTSGHDAFVGMEANRVEVDWGVGAYEKFYVKPLKSIFDQYRTVNPALLSDHGLIRKEFDAISGQVINELIEFRDDSRKTAAEKANKDLAGLTEGITDAVTTIVGMTGGIRVPGAKMEVSEGLKEFLSERKKSTGVSETPEEFVSRTSYDNTIEGYLDNKKKMEATS